MQSVEPDMLGIWDRPGYLIRRLHQIHVALFLAHVAQGEVTPTQYGVLTTLVNRPNIDQFTIGEELGLDAANVTDILRRLEARGLISRVVDAHNRRRKLCLTTPLGRQFVRRCHADMKASQEHLLAPLSEVQRKTFMALLTRLVEANNHSGRAALRPGGAALSLTSAAPARQRRAAA
jgi:DNA-binding MarR family transcriptional regulator